MGNEKLLYEIDKRLEHLFLFKGEEKRNYFKQIVGWIIEHPKLQNIYNSLDYKGYITSQGLRNIEKELYNQIKKERMVIIPIYNSFKKELKIALRVDYDLNYTDYLVNNYNNDTIFEMESVYQAYHWHRQIVEKLALINKEKVIDFINEHLCLSSESYRLFVKTGQIEIEFNRTNDKEEFGSLGYLRHILLEYGKETDIDCKSYIDVMGLDFLIFHLIKIRDLIYKVVEEGEKLDNQLEDNNLEKNTWPVNVSIEKPYIVIGCSKLEFYPDRNPMENKRNISFEVLQFVINSGQQGVLRSEIIDKISDIKNKDLSGYFNHINTKFEKLNGVYECKLLSTGARKNKTVFLHIKPSTKTRQ